MKKSRIFVIVWILFGLILVSSIIEAGSLEDPLVRIQDLTRIEGIRENIISGFGLVVGLNGTGDSRFSPTFQMLKNLLVKNGFVIDEKVTSKNIAAVQVTAKLPPFALSGDYLDVTVASYGDAKSLQGGVLHMTALSAPNGQVFAVAQGPLSLGGFGAGSSGNSSQKNHLQVARIPDGAIVERELEPDLTEKTELSFLLDQPNEETAMLIAQAINDHFKPSADNRKIANAVNAKRVTVRVPYEYFSDQVSFIAQIHNLRVRASMPAKVVINERTGTIVMGHNVRISTVAVAHGNLTVVISTQESTTVVVDPDDTTTINTTKNTQLNVEEQKNQLLELKTGATIGDVVKALNAIGASPLDIISILQAMKEAGAIYAEFELM